MRIPYSFYVSEITLKIFLQVIYSNHLTLAMPFCHECTGFASAIGGPYLGDHYLHKSSFQALQESSLDCKLCSLIVDRFDKTDQTRWILKAAGDDYPTAISFVGIDETGPWKYYQSAKDVWKGLVGLQINCGDPERNDDWSCGLGVFTEYSMLVICFSMMLG
jgi:hypothetical protein